jgi:hypothetical protein
MSSLTQSLIFSPHFASASQPRTSGADSLFSILPVLERWVSSTPLSHRSPSHSCCAEEENANAKAQSEIQPLPSYSAPYFTNPPPPPTPSTYFNTPRAANRSYATGSTSARTPRTPASAGGGGARGSASGGRASAGFTSAPKYTPKGHRSSVA